MILICIFAVQLSSDDYETKYTVSPRRVDLLLGVGIEVINCADG